MHLTKDDIEHVAWHRFNKKHIKYWYLLFFGTLGGMVAFTLGLNRLFPDNIWPAVSAVIAIMALLWVGMIRYNKLQQRAARELIKQCQIDPHLIYVPDQEVATAKDKAINAIK